MSNARRITALRNMTVANGCTEAEAKVAQEKLAEIQAKQDMSYAPIFRMENLTPEMPATMNAILARALRENDWMRKYVSPTVSDSDIIDHVNKFWEN